MEASSEGSQGPVGVVRRRWKEWSGMLNAIVRSYMTGPIEESSVETQARYWILKIVLLDFQRLFHRYTLQPQWSDIRLSDTPLYPTQPNDMVFTIFCSAGMHKLKLSCTGKAPKNHELSKTQLVMVFQFHIRTRKIHGWIHKFSEANFSTNFRIIRLFGNPTTNRSRL